MFGKYFVLMNGWFAPAFHSPTRDPFAWANAEASRPTDIFDTEIAALGALHMAYGRLSDYPERQRTAEAALSTAHGSALAAKRQVEVCLQNISQDAGEIVGVLEAARAYLTKFPSPTVCPLCESPDKIAGLAGRISRRLEAFSSLQTAQTHAKNAAQVEQRAEQQLRHRKVH